ncbi:class I SAM-dependent DNA methyltransferase [Paracoccus sp. YIM 132242]|uniref:site-specific DNA-methyltransferase (adenine-specific) n=1 Tax=Paracoccus lichenicola TaxID=2665644 RepID=A0A6L6HS38_9RHOB|nr:DNA methyltransferase [Paracoccus lichenicola]MTE01994.1 class I SAM-dependent DNA methyltransferase [Paracoccus lichenicola]
MTPHGFIGKWQNVQLKERSASQAHFIDLCRLLGVEDPVTADPKGDWFTFEKGAGKTTGGEGWADVWRKGCFAWEYKGRRKDLTAAFAQLQQYAVALENPPLLIVSDMDRIRIHTNWTNTVQQVHDIALDELADGAKRDLLRAAFTDPDRLRPAKTRQGLTEEAARRFAALAQNLRRRGHEPHQVAHFVNRLIFCMFAEDVGLLPNRMFQRMIEQAHRNPAMFQTHAATLFAAMQGGGMVGFEQVEWFNGGLFDNADALPLEAEDVAELLAAAALDWSEIDPSIMGTLFERGLDPDKRSQLGAHYTDRDKIMQIVDPVVVRPLLAEWDGVRADIAAALDRAAAARTPAARTRAQNAAQASHSAFLERLARFRVLDPACGSGNFLYLSLLALKDIEHRVNLDAESLGLPRGFPRVGPECVLGIELNPYAAELARVSVWIGEIQWMRRNGFEAARNPILRPLATIRNRDAVLAPDGTPADWPEADVVVGNPPFLGTKRMYSSMGVEYTTALRKAYPDISPFSDLVCWWFAQASRAIQKRQLSRAGLVATNSIRGGKNRLVLDEIEKSHGIFHAWSDEPWVVDGASVRVSLVCFGQIPAGTPSILDGKEVSRIESDLTGGGLNITKAGRLKENRGVAYVGTVKSGRFDLSRVEAEKLLSCPMNPNGRPNADVVIPWRNGLDLVRRSQDKWIIDFGINMPVAEAQLYEAPFAIVEERVKPERMKVKRDKYRNFWWLQAEPCSGMRSAIREFDRFVVSPVLTKHRLFVWLPRGIQPDHQLIAIARDDDTTFGILHSRFHELWSLRMGTSLEDRPRYTPSTTFETFPFPDGLTPDRPAGDYAADPRAQAIAAAAARLNELRENWLNPPDLVRRVPEVVPGYPDRILPLDARAEAELKKRTLTNLYNARPAWLAHAHAALDGAVADAYGWGEDWRAGRLTDDEILSRLFRLNQARAARQG